MLYAVKLVDYQDIRNDKYQFLLLRIKDQSILGILIQRLPLK